jgi:hypothetical protein
MRAFIAVSLLSLSAAAATPELELQAGWFHGTDLDLDPGAAELAVRAGADFGHFTLSGRLSVVPGNSVPDSGGVFQAQSGVSGWQALVEARVHSSGPVQLHLAVGMGLAQLSTWALDLTETRPLHGDAAFAWRISTGLRFSPQRWGAFGISLEGALSGWNGLHSADQPASFQLPPDPVTSFSVLGGLSFRFGR